MLAWAIIMESPCNVSQFVSIYLMFNFYGSRLIISMINLLYFMVPMSLTYFQRNFKYIFHCIYNFSASNQLQLEAQTTI
jgi:hypothetical protein